MKKDTVIEILDSMGDEFTVEELIQRLVFITDVDKGLQDVERGDVRSYEAVKRKFLNGSK